MEFLIVDKNRATDYCCLVKKRKYFYSDFYASLRKQLALQAKWNYLTDSVLSF